MTKRKSEAVATVPKAGGLAAGLRGWNLPVTPETVRMYLNDKLTDQEMVLFLNQCAMLGLNPFKREIYAIKYSAGDAATFVVGYEVYLKWAARSGKWGGIEISTEGNPPDMIAKVKVFRKDWINPLVHEVAFREYAVYRPEYDSAGRKTGNKVLTRFWAEKPRTMLKKVAIAQGLRMAFPEETHDLPYVQEEIGSGEIEEIPDGKVEVRGNRGPADEAVKDRTADFELKTVDDEFSFSLTNPGDSGDAVAEEKRARVREGIEALKSSGIGEQTIFFGISKAMKSKFGRDIAEVSELTGEEADHVSGYLHRWKKANETETEKRKATREKR